VADNANTKVVKVTTSINCTNQGVEHICRAHNGRVELIIIQAVLHKEWQYSVRHRSRRANDEKVGTGMRKFWYRTVIHLSVDGAVWRIGFEAF